MEMRGKGKGGVGGPRTYVFGKGHRVRGARSGQVTVE